MKQLHYSTSKGNLSKPVIMRTISKVGRKEGKKGRKSGRKKAKEDRKGGRDVLNISKTWYIKAN